MGTAQFGLNYGIANQSGQVSCDEASAIVRCARENGIDTLDTAIAYGDSEQRLGQIGVGAWRIVSKLPAMPINCGDVGGWVAETVQGCLARLRVRRLYGLLLHRPQQLLETTGRELYAALSDLKRQGLIRKIGISIYAPAELDDITSRFEVDLVQAPFNVFDRRMATTGWMKRLSDGNIEVHARSAFLQGLLLLSPGERPRKFDAWAPLWTRYDEWLRQSGLTALEACLRYVLSFPEIVKVVVGVDSQRQLRQVIDAARGPAPAPPVTFVADDLNLINPARWTSL